MESTGDTFQYIQRRKPDEIMASKGKKALILTHTLSDYPENLQKKVTLLKHLYNYLVEQQKKLEEHGFFGAEASNGQECNFVFIKKSVRTKYAILFRLSNQTVQIVFHEQIEILLTPDECCITYVDNLRNCHTNHFNDKLVEHPYLTKHPRYTKEITHQLISGQRR